MSAIPKAVFLSYAHEDAEAAKQVAEALRTASVEVWFDQSELRGGDAWDRKIKKQIKECALFVPVVSQSTQARKEGYFRLEWRLAEQRTQMMGKSAAFVVPVCIDDTKDEEADVPDAFLEVQWTRLPKAQDQVGLDALALGDFAQHVKQLIACGDIQFTPAPFTMTGAPLLSATPPSTGPASARPATMPARVGRRVPAAVWIVTVAVVLGALVYFFVGRKSMNAGAGARPATAEKTEKPKVDEKSIAVLPFKNQSPDPANAFFTDGVHEDILTSLFNIRDLHVVSRTSVEQYRDTKKPIKQIGEELRVAYVLEGSVQRVGNKVHVTGQLIDARTDRHAWARNFDKDISDIFAIQAELAKAIAGELQAVISPQEQSLVNRRPTENVAAYDLYLKSREIVRGLQSSQAARAQSQESLLQAAVTLDPQFALAWAALARVHANAYVNNVDHSVARLDKAKRAVETALRLAPDVPEVIFDIGAYYYYGFRDFMRAEENFQRVARMQPRNPEVVSQLGALYRRTGRWPEAEAAMRKGTQLDPGSLLAAARLASLLEAGHRYDEAKAERRRIAALDPGNLNRAFTAALRSFWSSGESREIEAFFAGLDAAQAASASAVALKSRWAVMSGNLAEYFRLEAPEARGLIPAIVRAAQGDRTGARARLPDVAPLRQRLATEPANEALWQELSQIEALLGHSDEALLCAHKATELVGESFDRMIGPPLAANLAFVHAWVGDKEAAIAEYARLLRTPFSELNVHVMKCSPEFFPLRGDPRFEALLNDPKNNAPLF